MIYIAYAATLPVLQREWSLSGTAAGSIASAFQVAYAVSLMIGTWVALIVGMGLLYGFAALFGGILDWYRVRNPGARGWAFVSLGIAGLVAVASRVLLHRTPAASVLHRRAATGAPAVAAPAR
jgi:hypothetical protein